MKKIFYFIGIFLAIFSNALHADVEEGEGEVSNRWYIGAVAGVNQTDAKTDVGAELGFCIGYNLLPRVRFEGEIVARTNRIKGEDVLLNTVVCATNLLYDMEFGFFISPYIGFGIGTQQRSIRIKEDDFELDLRNEKDAFAYQGIFGINIPLSERVTTCLEYRCIGNDQGEELSHSVGMNFKRFF